MPQDFQEYVRTPIPMPPADDSRRSNRPEVKLPAGIRAFATFCFVRSAIDLLFAMLVGFAPETTAAKIVAEAFGDRLPHVPAELEFFLFACLFAFVGWKWITRDWRIRWVAMFVSGALAARILIFVLADNAGQVKLLSTKTEVELSLVAVFNLLICAYLAFYPGMADAFKEKP